MIHDFKGRIVIVQEVFYNTNTNYGIYAADITEIDDMSPELKEVWPLSVDNRDITFKGETAKIPKNAECYVTADLTESGQYGKQFNIVRIARVADSHPTDYYSKRKVLSGLFTERQVKAMYDAYADPYSVFEENDPKRLTKIKGCGIKTAPAWQERFNAFIPTTELFLGLEEFDLSDNTIRKILKKYKDPALAIQEIKNNPYVLCDIDGIGWAKADAAALSSGLSPYAISRIEGFITVDLEYWAREKGMSYRYSTELWEEMNSQLNPLPAYAATEALQDMQDRNLIYWNPECRIIALQKYWKLENDLADEVLRLLDSEPLPFNANPNRIRYIIQRNEQLQGWAYTDEQLNGLKTVLENNFVIITGSAGTGKSSLVNLILQVFSDYHYEIAQTALSGRAAARLTEITHQTGSTIHRLLGYPRGEPENQKFLYHKTNQLTEQIIVVDEISMIGGFLFYDLLRAIRTGAKVILLGDTGQLEPIGECNVAYDLLQSGLIPTVTLNKIQRQAMTSAIVTESNKIRHGIQLFADKTTAGVFVRGELQDLIIDCYSDKHNTFTKTIQHFTECLKEDPDILNTQVLSPQRTKGESSNSQLNAALQSLYNPDRADTEILIRQSQTKGQGAQSYGIRVGDKVMNTSNRYSVPLAYEDGYVPVFNGNVGIVLDTDPATRTAIIDFVDVGVVAMDGDALRDVILSYAVTVHKYQGSECDNVIVALDNDSSYMLTRELVYTAITRAKKKCILVVQNSALCTAINNHGSTKKRTFLKEILKSRATTLREVEFIF